MRISDWSSDVCSSDLNFNPNMATAGKITIAEVEEIVPAGSFDPDHVHTPGIYVDRIIEGPSYEKRIEFLTTRPRDDAAVRMRSEEHTSELQSLMRISYAVFCLKKKTVEHDKHLNTQNEAT